MSKCEVMLFLTWLCIFCLAYNEGKSYGKEIRMSKPVKVNLVISKPKDIKHLSVPGKIQWGTFKALWNRLLDDELAKTMVWLDDTHDGALLKGFIEVVQKDLVKYQAAIAAGELTKEAKEE